MKKTPPPAKFQKRRAAALIIVLCCLVLLSGLTLGFFLSTAGEARNTTAFAEGNRAKTLADTALNFVIGQLRDATCQDRTDISWTSQPGLIKTFNTSGNLATAFKLYSSSQPRITATSFDPASDVAPPPPLPTASQAVQAAWTSRYADLNSPVIRKAGATATKYYPILNPAALGGNIEGFDVSPGWQLDTNGDGSPDIPMPVEWMYVFRDGSVGPASGGTTANPIIGRVAFWTDDDSCKVNINTASEGSFWDVPRSVALNEARMGWALPVKGEFQAITGHPATTSLSPVLGTLVGKPVTPLIPFGTSATEFSNYFLPYIGIAPRISNTTTTGTRTTQAGSQQTTVGSATGTGLPVVYDTDRLYATADELLFKPNRSPNVAALTGPELAKRDFFLTANSRAPETTLFGTPRLSLWPFQRLPAGGANDAAQSPRDQLLAFCGKIGANPYYFERASAATGRGIPAGTGSARSMTADYDTIPRNQALFTYLGQLLNQPVPGFGSSFTAKWGVPGNAQVSTMAYDYLRSNTNLYQVTVPSTNRGGDKSWGYEVPVPQWMNQGGYVVPIKINGKLGFGKSTIITEAAMVFIATKADPTTKQTTSMQSFMICNQYRPGPISAASSVGIRFRVTSTFGINGTVRQRIRMGSVNSGRNFAFPGAHQALWKNSSTDDSPVGRLSGTTDQDEQYALVTPEVAVTGPTFNFPGGTATIEILEPDGSGTIQTLNMEFPAISNLPLPQAVNGSGDFSAAEARTFDERAVFISDSGKAKDIIRFGDIVKSVRFSNETASPHKGDFRLLALKENVPASWFKPNSGLSDPAYNAAPIAYDVSGTNNNNLAARRQRFTHSLRNDIWSFGNVGQYGWGDGTNAPIVPSPPRSWGIQTAALGAGFNSALSGDNKVLPGGLLANLRMGREGNQTGTAIVPQGVLAVLNAADNAGDFTSNYGFCADGASIALPDFGTLKKISDGGYFSEMDWDDDTGEASEPNRQIPSPVVLGTLPSVNSSGEPVPWQTLLFCPNPSAGNTHPGFGTGASGAGPSARAPFSLLPDHLFLDFWWMPAVDPYALSEPLSTAGKVNLNYRIAPFNYITRSTGVQSVMKAVKLAAFPDTSTNNYSTNYKQQAKGQNAWGSAPQTPFSAVTSATRFNLNMSETDGSLQSFKARFDSGDVFRSASEICTVGLVPTGETTSTMSSWWTARRLTGDNLRESPYNALYSRVTTQSNTYTVHVKAEGIKKVPGTPADAFDPTRDQISGEWRGSFQIERYVDPNDPTLAGVDFASASPLKSLGPFYRFRVLSSSQFAP